MSFQEIVDEIKARTNLTSTEAGIRIGREVNSVYKKVRTSMGMQASSRAVAVDADTSLGSSLVTFKDVEKIIRVYDNSSGTIRELTEKPWNDLRLKNFGTGDPTEYAIQSHTASTVTILINSVMQEVLNLKADGYSTSSTLSGSQEPAFPEDFHDILVEGVLISEHKKKKELDLSKAAEAMYKERLSDLRMWNAKTLRMKTRQGENAKTLLSPQIGMGSGGGTTLPNGAVSYTETGLITFERAPLAPFAVETGSAVVPNLDAEKVGGKTGANLVEGPATVTDNAIARYDATTGKLIQDSGITIADGASGTLSGTNSGNVSLAGTPTYLTIAAQVITRALIDLASHITGRLPFANFVAATAASKLVGRQSGSSGDFQEITLGTQLAMSSTTLGVTTPGSDTQVLFNDGGATAGDAGLVYNKTTDRLTAALLTLSGGQISFPASQAASSGANDLDDYEEGTWTPTDGSGAALSLTSVEGYYVKIGQFVAVSAKFTYPSTADTTAAAIGGLPFTVQNTTNDVWSGLGVNNSSSVIGWRGTKNATNVKAMGASSGSQFQNNNLTTTVHTFTLVYRATA